MVDIKLVGSPPYYRYQKMSTLALKITAKLGLNVQLDEVNDAEQLFQYNPLDLPRLHANGTLIASRYLSQSL